MKPVDKIFSDLKKVVKEHVSPKPPEIIQRYKFHSRVRQIGESMSVYVAELRNLLATVILEIH